MGDIKIEEVTSPQQFPSVDDSTLLKIFDWGRSEFNTLEKHHAELSDAERASRVERWRYYIQSVCRLFWQLCRVHFHRFCFRGPWRTVVVEVQELDIKATGSRATASSSRSPQGPCRVNKRTNRPSRPSRFT